MLGSKRHHYSQRNLSKEDSSLFERTLEMRGILKDAIQTFQFTFMKVINAHIMFSSKLETRHVLFYKILGNDEYVISGHDDVRIKIEICGKPA